MNNPDYFHEYPLTFVNCSEDLEKSLCENYSSLFGKSGTCNTTTGFCECPGGPSSKYSGNDDWGKFNACFVNEDLQTAMRWVSLAFAIVGWLIAVGTLLSLAFRWGLCFIPEGDEEENDELRHELEKAKKLNDSRSSNNNTSHNKSKNKSRSKNKKNDNGVGREKDPATTSNERDQGGSTGALTPFSTSNSPEEEGGSGSGNGSARKIDPRSSPLALPSPREEDEVEDSDDPNAKNVTTSTTLDTGTGAGIDTGTGAGTGAEGKSSPRTDNNDGGDSTTSRKFGSKGSLGVSGKGKTADSNASPTSQANAGTNNGDGSNDDISIFEAASPLALGESSRIGGSSRSNRGEGSAARGRVSDAMTSTIGRARKRLPRPSVVALKQLAATSESAHGMALAPNMSFRGMVQERKRKRNTLLVVLLIAGFYLFLICYNALMLRTGNTHAEGDLSVNFTLSGALSSLLASFWLVAFIWFSSLPSVGVYARLFNINNILLRHPNLMRYVTVINVTMGFVVTFSLFFFLPMAFPDKGKVLDTAALILAAVFVINFLVIMLLICHVLMKCFDMLEQRIEKAGDEKKTNPVSAARATVQSVQFICATGGPVAVGLAFLMAFYEEVRRNMHFFMPVLGIVGCFVGTFIVMFVVRRTAGKREMSPEKKKSMAQRGASQGSRGVGY